MIFVTWFSGKAISSADSVQAKPETRFSIALSWLTLALSLA